MRTNCIRKINVFSLNKVDVYDRVFKFKRAFVLRTFIALENKNRLNLCNPLLKTFKSVEVYKKKPLNGTVDKNSN